MPYIYNDEDNVPMNDDTMPGVKMDWKRYSDIISEMSEDPLPFTDPPLPEKGCWNCMNFNWDREACTVNWNNMDDSYYNPATDDRDYTDSCEDNWELNPDATPEDFS